MAAGLSEGKKETVKSGLLSATGGILGKVLAVPVNIIVASILGTAGYGILAVINVIIQYLGYLNLGMLSNITREVPLAHGRGDNQEVQTIYGTISSNYALTTCIGLIVLWIGFNLGFDFEGQILTIHLSIVSCVVIVANTHSFFYSMVKGEGQFITYGQYELVSRLFTPVGTLTLVWFFGLNGMLLSLMWTHVLGLGFLLWQLDYPSFRPAFNWSKTKELMSTGLLMYLNKIIDGVFASIAIIIAGKYLNVDQVGILGFALGFASAKKLPFARVLWVTTGRKMALEGGKHGLEDKSIFVRFFETPYFIYLMVLSALLGLLILFYSEAVRYFLPDFRDSIAILVPLFFALTFYNARLFAYSYINVTRQMNSRTLILGVGLTTNALLGWAAIQLGYGVMGLAMSVALSMMVVSVHTIFFTFGQLYETLRQAWVFVFKLSIIAGVLTVLLYASTGIEMFARDPQSPNYIQLLRIGIELGLESFTFLLVTAVLYFAMFRNYDVAGETFRLTKYAFSTIWLRRRN